MISVHEARQLRLVARRAEKHEKEIDTVIRATIMANNDSVDFCVGNDHEVATFLQTRYRAYGWKVEISEFDPDRVTKPVEYTLSITLPEEPQRGGPDDR